MSSCVFILLFVSLLSLHTQAQPLPQFDASAIKSRVMHDTGGLAERVDRNIELYRQFWFMHKHFPFGRIMPNPDVDQIWRAHILHTAQYSQDSHRYFGSFFHYHPIEYKSITGKGRRHQVVNSKENQSVERMSCSSGGMVTVGMPTYFTWTMSQVLLFQWWNTQGEGKYYALSVLVIVTLVIFKEWLFVFRMHLAKDLLTSVTKPLNDLNEHLLISSDAALTRQGATRERRGLTLRDTWKIRLMNALLGTLNLLLGYFLMLIVMTYNSGFFLAIILAAAASQFLFSMPWRSHAIDPVEAEVDCCER